MLEDGGDSTSGLQYEGNHLQIIIKMVLCRFLGGVCCSLIIVASFVLSQELVGTEWRSFCGMLLSMFFALGIAVFSALSAIVGDWRTLTLICSVVGIAFLVFPWYVDLDLMSVSLPFMTQAIYKKMTLCIRTEATYNNVYKYISFIMSGFCLE